LDLRRHRWVQADVVSWLAQNSRERFDLIYVDPPSFSNSKRTTTVFDVQRDHVSLLQTCIDLLAPGGRVLFVCNLRKFKLDPIVAAFARVDEVTEASIPPDFARDQRIHRPIGCAGQKLNRGPDAAPTSPAIQRLALP
jgi:23S rRNA (guanine2445-N2)-methyltransferase / 23S rRNA (guanine2069-N7)-methyltransferase